MLRRVQIVRPAVIAEIALADAIVAVARLAELGPYRHAEDFEQGFAGVFEFRQFAAEIGFDAV